MPNSPTGQPPVTPEQGADPERVVVLLPAAAAAAAAARLEAARLAGSAGAPGAVVDTPDVTRLHQPTAVTPSPTHVAAGGGGAANDDGDPGRTRVSTPGATSPMGATVVAAPKASNTVPRLVVTAGQPTPDDKPGATTPARGVTEPIGATRLAPPHTPATPSPATAPSPPANASPSRAPTSGPVRDVIARTMARLPPGPKAAVTAAGRTAARLVETFPANTIPDFADAPVFERWCAPIGLVLGVLGVILFASAANFGLATVLLVLATGLLVVRGVLSMRRFLELRTQRNDHVMAAAETATRLGAWSSTLVFALMTASPIITDLLLRGANFSGLSIFTGAAALAVGYFAVTGTPLKGSLKSWAFGVANGLALVVAVMLLMSVIAVLVSPSSTPVNHVQLLNRYFFLLSSAGALLLGILMFLVRFAAMQRLQHKA